MNPHYPFLQATWTKGGGMASTRGGGGNLVCVCLSSSSRLSGLMGLLLTLMVDGWRCDVMLHDALQ